MAEQPSDLITRETIAVYRAGPPAESSQFDFLLGAWKTETKRYDSNGDERLAFEGSWTARHLAGGRIVLDETVGFDADGTEISSMATLRTFSPVAQRWEMTFLSAHQPMLPISLTGTKVDREIHLDVGLLGDPDTPVVARLRFFDITADSFEWEQRVRLDDTNEFRRAVSIRAQRA